VDLEFDRIVDEGNAAASKSIFGSGKPPEQHAVLRPELDALDLGLILDMQRRLACVSVQKSDAPLIHEDLNRIRGLAGRAVDAFSHVFE
jgi:hypothetical protein